LDKYALVDDIKTVIIEIIDVLKEKNILTFEVLKTNLPQIMESLNKMTKFEITVDGEVIETIDIQHLMKEKKLDLKSKERVRRGII
jgi:hypothetical protein